MKRILLLLALMSGLCFNVSAQGNGGGNTNGNVNNGNDKDDETGKPLPVELLSFTGELKATGVHLKWITVTEDNNDRFEIERSDDATKFIKVGEVSGNGNSIIKRYYSYQDKINLSANPLYYRLKQVDFDGKFEYSRIIAIRNKNFQESEPEIYIFPNPVVDQFTITSDAKIEDVTLISLAGVQIATFVGGLDNFNINHLNLSEGFYLLQIKIDTNIYRRRILIKK